ncbi:NAD-dependent epimerase/dehydratase family protein [Aspergillus lucknowensis]|uniref:NAD-dependent epimerase/dehydratase domain-containing protein n=1 Tax=Aspergillus lucknowensis TaxID=176173 RepID=A0ABR4M4N5_9EURO
MAPHILVTGAGGYIGGSIAADLLNAKEGFTKGTEIHAAVRSQEQAQSLSGLAVNVAHLDLGDKKLVENYLLSHDIDIVINTATSIDRTVALNLISGLSARRAATGKESYLIHTSGLSAFDEVTSWPFGPIKDTDAVYDLESKSKNTYIVRQVDTLIVEHCKASGVMLFMIFPPTLHGRGSGTWNQLSPQIPSLIKAGVKERRVYKFPDSRDAILAHISDIAAFFTLLVNAILRGDRLPEGQDGYYFLVSHEVSWWEILEKLAARLYARGLIDSPDLDVWPSEKVVAEAVGVPVRFAHSMWNASAKITCERQSILGWQPKWNKEQFLSRLDDEIDDFLELGLPKSSLLDSLKPKSAQ